MKWAVSVEPSEPVPWTLKVSWKTALFLFKLTPNHEAKWPVYEIVRGGNGTKLKLPSLVPVIQRSPAWFTVTWKTELVVIVRLPVGGPVMGSTQGTFVGNVCTW